MSDLLAWLAVEAGLPMVESPGPGQLHPNAAARARLGAHPPAELEAAVAALLGRTALPSEVTDALARGTRGERATAVCGDGRVLVVPDEGTLRVVVVDGRRASAHPALGLALAHEVSNALSAIAGWAEIGRRDASQSGDALSVIESSARAARAAARHLLDTDLHVDELKPVDVGVLVHNVSRLLRPHALERQVTIDVGGIAEAWARADAGALFTVVSNLIQNAIEAQPSRVEVWTEAAGREVRIGVRDDGPGLDDSQVGHIFEAHYTTKTHGSGLGLALVHDAVRQLDGRIELESAPGRGSAFVVELVATARPDVRLAAAPQPRRSSGIQEKMGPIPADVLVVEDDRALREMVHTTLEIHGARVTSVPDVATALGCKGPFDVTLVDLVLPDGRGDALLAELYASGLAGATALLSGAAEPPDLHPRGRPDAWLRKPFEPDELIALVTGLCARTHSGTAAKTSG